MSEERTPYGTLAGLARIANLTQMDLHERDKRIKDLEEENQRIYKNYSKRCEKYVYLERENYKLREERDEAVNLAAVAGLKSDNKRLDKDIEFLNAVGQITSQLQSAQQEIAELKAVQALWRDINPSVYDMQSMIAKLIEGLRWYAKHPVGTWGIDKLDIGARARTLLAELGVSEK